MLKEDGETMGVKRILRGGQEVEGTLWHLLDPGMLRPGLTEQPGGNIARYCKKYQ